MEWKKKGDGFGLEYVQRLGASDCLSAAPHAQFAVDAVEVPLYRANGDNELLRDLSIGQTRYQEPKDREFALGERLNEWKGARGSRRLRTASREEGRDVVRCAAACVCLMQQRHHRFPLIDKHTDVPLLLSEYEGSFENSLGLYFVRRTRKQGERLEHQDFQDTIHTR
jgi:hypothetical protein